MIKQTIHENLIDSIRIHTSKRENPVDLLTSIIPSSKEAAYRRLRGDIPFTLSEAVRISEQLNLSLDEMAGIDKKDTYPFHINPLFIEDPFERYYDLMNSLLSTYRQMRKDPNSFSYYAGHTLLPPFYFRYKALSKYSFFKWLYQISYMYGTVKRLQDVCIPEKIIEIQQELYEESIHVSTCLVFGNEIIFSIANDLNYFTEIELVTPDEATELKKEILLMLDNIEKATQNTCFPKTGKKALIYTSDAFFDGNYSYMSGAQLQISTIYLYGINQLTCNDPSVCKNQKSWIESLIAHSTLISGSGKLHRSIFLNQQK
jgi:hypothetical protein